MMNAHIYLLSRLFSQIIQGLRIVFRLFIYQIDIALADCRTCFFLVQMTSEQNNNS